MTRHLRRGLLCEGDTTSVIRVRQTPVKYTLPLVSNNYRWASNTCLHTVSNNSLTLSSSDNHGLSSPRPGHVCSLTPLSQWSGAHTWYEDCITGASHEH